MGSLNVSFILSFVLFLEYIPSLKADLRCYRCIVASPVVNYEGETYNLCKDFDYSEKFIVNCPYSTFCVKKIVSAKIPYLINGTERDCASQKLKQHKYQNKMWHVDYIVEDPYIEGCVKADDKGARTTTAEYCYCKGDLCNAASASGGHFYRYILTAVIVLFSKSYLCYRAL
ncbi:uncharacterized protein LOC108908756 [Anoplophora glabripennis]|uniref:uncharacterized protein LOC108908756 n=1 Tax=Anoplophora glabripennis TaxID=217634 RepID=UPI000873E8A3|nr:uncharacterized protein LOC108908756 [Anoplophora glabripennis]